MSLSSKHDGFMQDIVAHPDDDSLRLIYADFLEDQGEIRDAEMIRAQVALAKVPEYDSLHLRYWYSERDFITGRGFKDSLPKLPEGLTWGSWPFIRGCPAEIQIRDIDVFVKHAHDLFQRYPIESLKIASDYRNPPEHEALIALFDCPQLSRIRKLLFSLSQLNAFTIQPLLHCGQLENLTQLAFEFGAINAIAVGEFFQASLLQQLTHVKLRENNIGWITLDNAICDAGGPYQLKHLILEDSIFVPANRLGLFYAPLLTNLKELELSRFELGSAGMQAIGDSRLGDTLEALTLSRAHPGLPGMDTFTQTDPFQELQVLRLICSRLGPYAMNRLIQSPCLANLSQLVLTDNPIKDKGAITLAEASMDQLLHLNLMHCQVGEEGARAIMDTPFSKQLLKLYLNSSDSKDALSDEMKKELRQHFGDRIFV